MSDQIDLVKMGWLPDYPDVRDYSIDYDSIEPKLKKLGQKDSVKDMLVKVGIKENKKLTLPTSIDLRPWCAPIENQLNLGSCTAHAGIGILEYFERRSFGKHLDASRLFLYKTTRNLMQVVGDTGAFIRTTMGALILFGAPPEEYWKYIVANYEIEPTAFCYAFGQNYQTINYYRYDPPGINRNVLLNNIKTTLAGGLPSMFGFSVYDSYGQGNVTGKIPYPAPLDRRVGGHAIVAVGFDDNLKIKNTNPRGIETKGALLIRNSWGTSWGDKGYGWLPYAYVLNGLAVDWWSILKNEWIDTGNFKI